MAYLSGFRGWWGRGMEGKKVEKDGAGVVAIVLQGGSTWF